MKNKKRVLIVLVTIFLPVFHLSAQERLLRVVMRLMENCQFSDNRNGNRLEYECGQGEDGKAEWTCNVRFVCNTKNVDAALLEDLRTVCKEELSTAVRSSERIYDHDSLNYLFDFDKHSSVSRSESIRDGRTVLAGEYGTVSIGKEVFVAVNCRQRSGESVSAVDLSGLNSFFGRMAVRRGVKAQDVQYVGVNGSFLFQKHDGKGGTFGTRYTLSKARKADWKMFVDTMLALKDSRQPLQIIFTGDCVNICTDGWDDFYLASYKGDSIFFYHPILPKGGDVCIPSDWEWIDTYDGRETPISINGRWFDCYPSREILLGSSSDGEDSLSTDKKQAAALSVNLLEANLKRLELSFDKLRQLFNSGNLSAEKKADLKQRLEAIGQELKQITE